MSVQKLVFTLGYFATTAFSVSSLWAQSAVWPAPAALHQVNAAYAQAPAVIILNKHTIEHKTEEGNLVREDSYYQVFKIHSAEGQELFTHYPTLRPLQSKLYNMKARITLANGKSFDITPHTVKMDAARDEKGYARDGQWVQCFRVDSVQKDAEVELMYQVKSNVELFGSEVLQDDWLPCQQAVFTFITSDELRFSVKGFHGCVVEDETIAADNRRFIIANAVNLPALPDEKFSFAAKHRARIDYKLSYNANSPARLYTWNAFAKKASQLYTTRNASEEKALAQLIAQISIPLTAGQGGQVAAIEDYVKTNIHIAPPGDSLANLTDLVQIIDNKKAGKEGAIRLMAGLLTQMKIPFQLAFTANRTDIPLDEELEYWERAKEVLLYFPAINKYISAGEAETRYPHMNPLQAGTRALLVKDTVMGARKAVGTSFQWVPMDSAQYNFYNLEEEVNVNPRMDSVFIKEKRLLGGYAGADYLPAYRNQPREKQGEMSKALLALPGDNQMTHVQVRNFDYADAYARKPLTLTADVYSRSLITNMMNKKLVLNIGKLIGEQYPAVSDTTRKLPVELDFGRTVTRTITLRLPRTYLVTNADELKTNISYTTAEGGSLSFKSSYSIKGYTLFLTVQETYSQVEYSAADYSHFIAVRNAAAAFYEKILILEKK
ncbi:hypothetical protein SAMN05421788_106275 [Filimonas lacunae]|uniref:DUF3857 domain-containing protein n=1 Tax=Filimonas lacunae TaxID=477680 RepID=A0A173MFJ1_9BACT|nr:DUF3857 domain-containing protein [Filimonas lacunae]BAV06208.1 hypothetical protein FLA_2224 [Filimonas lacunae]SIT25278.1 hypothetical protein SAMN05421788_106275 [Filimonas lacunae]